jgi:hypothetical protein
MTSTASKTLSARLLKEFETTCQTLAALALLPKPMRKKTASAYICYEGAGRALIKAVRSDDDLRKSWLRLAATSLSPALVRAFGDAPANSVAISLSNFNWNDIAKHASAEHLEAIHASGINMTGAHMMLLERALKAKGADIHDFLLTHIETIWDRSSHLYFFSIPELNAHPQFLARYFEAAKNHHFDDLQRIMEICTWGLSGRDMLILHCLGIPLKDPLHIPDGAKGAFEGHSPQRQKQIEGWKTDLASLLGDEDALRWARDELVPQR